jgi:hypothetical protein
VPIDNSETAAIDRSRSSNSRGWRSLVQSVVDYERMDKVLNRWRQYDVLYLQVRVVLSILRWLMDAHTLLLVFDCLFIGVLMLRRLSSWSDRPFRLLPSVRHRIHIVLDTSVELLCVKCSRDCRYGDRI